MTEFMGLAEKVSKFNQEALKHLERQTLNPFSGRFSRSPSPRPKFNKDEYGKPAAGSLTEKRGQRAFTQISREILELCETIHDMGTRRRDSDGDECIIIPFGELFAFYTKISDKVVGLLIAGKKRGFVWFEPEILFQRRDDDVLIALLKPIEEIRNIISRQVSASPSPAPTVASEPEKTSFIPSPLARQEITPSESSSTPAESENQSISLASAVSAEEQQSSSSTNAENTPQQTASNIDTDDKDQASSLQVSSGTIEEKHNLSVNAAEVGAEQTTTPEPISVADPPVEVKDISISEKPSPDYEGDQNSSITDAELPVEVKENSPSDEPLTPSERDQNESITVSDPPVEVKDNLPSDESSLPSEGEHITHKPVAEPPVEVEDNSPSNKPSPLYEEERTPPSSEAIEAEQVSQAPKPTIPLEEEKTIPEPLAASEDQDCLTLKIIVECDQDPTTSTAAESEKTPLYLEVEETFTTTAQVAPDDNEQTTFSPTTTIEPEERLLPGDESGEVISSTEKEQTAPSNETDEKTQT